MNCSKSTSAIKVGTCQAEAMLNSEKIKPIALAVIKLRLSEVVFCDIVVIPFIMINYHNRLSYRDSL